MDKGILARMRKLRKKAADLSGTIDDDLNSFRHKEDHVTFRRRPSSGSIANDTGVTTTCSCLIALAISGKLDGFYKDADGKKKPEDIRKAFDYVMKGDEEDEWKSSELDPCNAFTTTLVLRAFGFLKQVSAQGINSPSDFIHTKYPRGDDNSLTGIIKDLVEDPENRFKINEYPATPTIIYWFVDSIERAAIDLQQDEWKGLFIWAARSFLCQLSRVSAKQEVLMDPISMAMAACLSAKLRNIAKYAKLGASPKLLAHLPSMIELKNSIHLLFKDFQSECGIWPKYFPLFHYGKDAGSNYCFTFEMLEAILSEFGEGILIDNYINTILPGLEDAVRWCCDNRVDYLHEKKTYSGWNSGGLLQTLEAGEPESWATAVVHMFLYTLQDVLTRRIEELLLEEYKAVKYKKSDEKWKELIDIDLESEQLDAGSTVKNILQEKIIVEIESRDCKVLRNESMNSRLSALLFGPPGTSKTELVKAIAQRLGWPLIMIDPSHFLSKGLERIYSEADNVFDDLLDLSDTVILFDEMDGLVRTRDEKDGNSLDITSRFLTTSMLPKLAKLHDKGRSLFFMATNYIEDFDPAIKRPGRFDLLLCMWPPSWEKKVEALRLFVGKTPSDDDVEECKGILKGYTLDGKTEDLLNVFTFGETKAFIEHLRGNKDLKDVLSALTEGEFTTEVKKYGKYITLNENETKKTKYKNTLARYSAQKALSCLQ